MRVEYITADGCRFINEANAREHEEALNMREEKNYEFLITFTAVVRGDLDAFDAQDALFHLQHDLDDILNQYEVKGLDDMYDFEFTVFDENGDEINS